MVMDLSNIPDLGSRQLLAVLAIADYGSFIAAAAFLPLSPSRTRRASRKPICGLLAVYRPHGISTRPVALSASKSRQVASGATKFWNSDL